MKTSTLIAAMYRLPGCDEDDPRYADRMAWFRELATELDERVPPRA